MCSASPVLPFYSCTVTTPSPTLWATPCVPCKSSGPAHPSFHCSHCWSDHSTQVLTSLEQEDPASSLPKAHCLCLLLLPLGFLSRSLWEPAGQCREVNAHGPSLSSGGWESSATTSLSVLWVDSSEHVSWSHLKKSKGLSLPDVSYHFPFFPFSFPCPSLMLPGDTKTQ